jgi:sugar lactone lactonase YvrE
MDTIADDRLIKVAESPDYQWNGVALTKTNRIFASFPRLYQDVTLSVAEILPNNSLQPIPGGDWNTFNPINSSENADKRFVNVNAILTDSNDNLWVVDSGMIGNKTFVNGSKLVQINLNTNTVQRIYSTSTLNPPTGFALNDVRIGSQYAFLTESGLGSLVIINLENGQVRRVLDEDSSTKFVDPTVVRMEGRAILDEKGQPKQMQNNNLELTPDEKILYYKPSFSFNWFQISTDDLLNETLSASQLGDKVSTSWKTMPTGGTTMDDKGFIYLMDLERQAVWQQSIIDGSWKLIVRDERIIWGDASDISNDGFLYIPMAQNNRISSFNNGTNQVEKPFQMYKIKINSASSIITQNIFIFILFLMILFNNFFQ